MKKRKRKATMRKGVSVTAALTIFLSNASLAVPTTVTFAEGSKQEVSQKLLVGEVQNQGEEGKVQGGIAMPSEPTSNSPLTDTTKDSEQAKEEQDSSTTETPASEPNEQQSSSTTNEETTSSPEQETKSDAKVQQEESTPAEETEANQDLNDEETEEEQPEQEEADEAIDPQLVPPLLITEIMPNNAGADDYEFFEVYNNSDQPIVLDHYTFSLRYTDGSENADVDMDFSPVTLAPKETIVFWHNSNNKALADLNAHYQSNLSEENVVEFSGVPNFYNSGNRAVVIKDQAGNDLVSANYLADDIGNGQVVHYQYPASETEMAKLETKAQPTIGTVSTEQVPEEAVKLDKNQAPVISHEPVSEANSSEDLVLSASISDDKDDVTATVFYQTGDNQSYKKISMTKGNDQNYQAVIQKEELTTETLSYYIVVTDPNHRVTHREQDPIEVSIQGLSEIDYDALPQLLITELSPNSNGGGTDYYEYFEIYNNSDQPQLLTNYSFIYRYTDTGNELPFQIPVTTIQPNETLVFWFNNGNRTLAQFNEEYGTDLKDEQVVQFKDAFPGFANGGNRALVLKDQQGAEVTSASYLGTENDNNGAVIQYRYPKTGTAMDKLQVLATPTPGSMLASQVPEVPVQLPEAPADTEAPVIEHTAIEESDAFHPVKIEAKVTDNLSVPIVTLHYKDEQADTFTSLVMNPSTEDPTVYTAEIPASVMTTDVNYFIEASDGVNVDKTRENTIKVKEQEVDFNKVPQLLVTEVVPDSTNIGTADGFEYIEIYNNSNKDINFKDYKLYYRYGTDPGTDVVWPSIPEDVVIPAGKTLVFWIINDQNGDATVADFNANYGANLVENEDIVRIYSGGMANGSMRGLVIGTNAHKEISLAYYNDVPNVDDSYPDQGIVYKYPVDQSSLQVKMEIKDATPGQVEAYQVPRQPVELANDSTAPTIENLTSINEVNQKENIDLIAKVTDDQEVKSVRLFYKTNDQDEEQMVILQQNKDDKMYHSIIYSPELIGKEYVEYYFVASDGTNEVKSETYRVSIEDDFNQDSLRLNVQDDEIVNGQVVLKGTSDSDQPADLQLLIDQTELTGDIYDSVEREAYFAFEVNGLNTYFQNAVTIGDEILYLMDQDWLTSWKTFSIPIDADRLKLGENTITIRSGNKASPFELDSPENRDDYDLRNVRLVLGDGTVLHDPNYLNPSQVLKMNDANPYVDFTFEVKNDHAQSKTYNWDTTSVADGKHTIKLQGTNEETSATVIVDNTAPSVETTLEEGKEFKGAFTIDAEVTDAIAGVESVVTYLDDEEITLPLETASSKLTPGEHKLTIHAIDKVGNTSEHVVHFSVVNENPDKPEAISPADGQSGDPTLQVKVNDPTGDEMDVTFYQGYQYNASQTESVSGFKHASDTEPPQTMVPEGEQSFSTEDISLVSELDGQYLTTDSKTQFPYHRFEVELDPSVDESDIVELAWQGHSLEGRKVSLYAWNHQTERWQLIDYKIAGAEDFELKGNVSVSEFAEDSKINVLVQDEIPASPDEYDYSFVWMSDTQYYAESFPYIFDRQTQWIAEKQDEMKIEYVMHTGDLVNVSTDDQQWQYADQYMQVLDDHQIPYGVLAGNHDVDQVSNDYTDYYRYFGADRFENKPYYGESYLNNRGHYDLISAGGNDFIMLYLGWGVTDEGIKWMNDVLAANPDRIAILNFHEYLQASGTRHPLGEKLYNEVVLPNENVVAVLSGHYHEAQTLIDEIDDNGDGTPDRTVYQMLADYQAGPEGGQGYMRLLHFDQDNNRVIVNTYSPYLDDYNFYDTDANPGKDEFVINLDLSAAEKVVATDYFTVNVYTDTEIGQDENVESGGIAETTWSGLTEGNAYSWYAIAEDGHTGRTVSDIWTFVKGANEEPTPPPTTDPSDENDGDGEEPNEGDNSGSGSNSDTDSGEKEPPFTPEQPGEPDQSGDSSETPKPEENEQPAEDNNSAEKDNTKQEEASKTPTEKNGQKQTQTGSNLPSTATNLYNLLLAGAVLIIFGTTVLVVQRKKRDTGTGSLSQLK